MGRSADQYDKLATMEKLGLASAFQRKILWCRLLEVVKANVCIYISSGYIRRSDSDDVSQDAIMKVFDHIKKWDVSKAGITTYAARIARSVIIDKGRWYKRDCRALAIAAEQAKEAEEQNANR